MLTAVTSWYFRVARFFSDLILIPFIIVLAYSVKFKLGPTTYHHAQFEPYFQVSGFIVLIWIITFFYSGMYRHFGGIMSEVDEFVKVVKGVSIATIEVMAFSFLYVGFPGSRYVIFYAWGLGIIVLYLARLGIHYIEMSLLKRGIGAKPTLIIGADPHGQDIAEKIVLVRSLGLHYVGTLDEHVPEKLHFHLRESFSLLGAPADYSFAIRQTGAKVVFVTKHDLDPYLLQELVISCQKADIQLHLLSDFASLIPGTIQVKEFDGLPFLSYVELPKFTFGMALKRLFDFVCSLLGLIMLSPVFLVIAIIVKMVSPSGPVFYTQERVGKGDRVFKMIKFRTMVPHAEHHTGPVFVDKEETRYIPVGKFLRQTSLDELPQLFNVLMGDMSIVGPRPERPFFVEKFEKTIPYFSLRHHVRGGITGWAQINGRSVLSRRPEHKIKYDLYYIKNWTFIFDIKILLKTLFVVFLGEEAY